MHFPKVAATISLIALSYNMTESWCLCPFPLEYGWACDLYPVEIAEVTPHNFQGQIRKGSAAPRSLSSHLEPWSCHVKSPTTLRPPPWERAKPRGEVPCRHSSKQIQSSNPPGLGIRHVSEEAFSLFQPPIVAAPPDFKSSQLSLRQDKAETSCPSSFQIPDP